MDGVNPLRTMQQLLKANMSYILVSISDVRIIYGILFGTMWF